MYDLFKWKKIQMNDNIMDTRNATPQEMAILMLMERVDKLEQDFQLQKLETERTIISDCILSCDGKRKMTYDIFMYLLDPSNYISNVMDQSTHIIEPARLVECMKITFDSASYECKARATELHHVQGGIPPWQWEYDTKGWWTCPDYGKNLAGLLNAMTHNELMNYWNYRLKRLKYKV